MIERDRGQAGAHLPSDIDRPFTARALDWSRNAHSVTASDARRQARTRGVSKNESIMHTLPQTAWIRCLWIMTLILGATAAQAAPDEITVFSDDIQSAGTLGLAMHLNYVPSGPREPAFDGARPSGGATRLMPEITYGLGHGWETALHLPASRSSGENFRSDGVKLRFKYVSQRNDARDDARAGFFWGGNIELARFSRRFAEVATSLELKAIGGWRGGGWLVLGNLNVDRELGSDASRHWGLHPSAKLAYSVTDRLALGIERYHDLDRLHRAQSNERINYLVADWAGKRASINFGVGKGFGAEADRWVVKAVIGFALE